MNLHCDAMLLPESGDCPSLFYRSIPVDAAVCKETALHICAGGSVSFDTYYNMFPLRVYREFTVCRTPALYVTVQGGGVLTLLISDENGRILAQKEQPFETAKPMQLCLLPDEIPTEASVLCWTCRALTDCTLFSAYVQPAPAPQRRISLAVGICTYRRENFVIRNAKRIAALFSATPQHHLFIADNGNTLQGRLPAAVSLLPNPNTGGSGGFARVMQEVLRHGESFTHLLLMDDDLHFRPEILLRTICFLSYCREEYRSITVGGAMCLLDKPWQQFEAGAVMKDGGALQGLQMQLDLRQSAVCIRNASAPQRAAYNSWWYCCMSVEKIRTAGLPMPFFIKLDDVEYALRLGVKTVCLPGVCVAHESFEKKYNPTLEYYIRRNTLITCALHGCDGNTSQRLHQLFTAVLRPVLLQRYDCAELLLRAYRDFLKGGTFLEKTDAAALNREISGSIPLPEPAENTVPDKVIPVSRVKRLLTLNGLLLPCRRKSAAVDALHAGTQEAYRVQSLVHMYPLTGLQYRTVLRRSEVLRLTGKTILTAVSMLLRYGRARRSYREMAAYLQSEDFWQRCNAFDAERD